MGNDVNLMDQLSDMLSNNGNIPDNIKEMINGLKSSPNNTQTPNNSNQQDNQTDNSNSNNDNNNPLNNIDFDMILKAKRIADTMTSNNDPRKTLLLSLKPYLKEEKKEKIDQYIQFLSLSKILEEFGPELFGSGKNAK